LKGTITRKLLPLALAGGLATGVPALGTGAASAAGGQSVRHVVYDGTRALPKSQMGRPTSGVQSHEKPPAWTNKINRSLSTSGAHSAPTAPRIPTVAPTAITNPGTTTLSFGGLNSYDQRYANMGNQFSVEPPDQGLCAGNGFVVETLNDVFRAWDTSGNPKTGVIDLNTFYGYPAQYNRTTGDVGPFVTDPSCLYDRTIMRWFVVALTLEVDPSTGALLGPNHLDIAVSKTNDPTGHWRFYHIAAQDDGTDGTPSHTDCPCIGDYPHIGADKFGFFITTNEYPFVGPGDYGNNYNGAQIYAVSKSQLASGVASPTMVQFESPTLGSSIPSFTVWPANVPGTAFDTANTGTEWFLQSSAAEETLNATGASNKLGVFRITGTSTIDSTPALVLKSKVLTSKEYVVPPKSEQKVGPVPQRDCFVTDCAVLGAYSPAEVEGPLDSNDSRMQQTWLAGGYLYGALDTLVDVNGRYQAGVAYFVVSTSATLSSVAIHKQGYLAVNGNVTYPAIAVRTNGTGVMAMTLVGENWYPSAAYINIGPAGISGTVQVAKAGAGPEDGFCEYNIQDCAGTGSSTSPPTARPRWGDYGAALVNGSSLWIASEYIGQRCTIDAYLVDFTCGGSRGAIFNWGTRISELP
jgi:hypothetical protein